jgi:hypothetical protein
MTDYTKNTNFTAKDALASGHPNKVIKGSEFDTEFDEIATASATKEDKANKGAVSGYCGLDASGYVAAANLTSANLPAATDAAQGAVELATDAEVTTGTDTARAVTPAGLQQKVATETALGIIELATNAEVTTGTDTARAVTPAGLEQKTASTSAKGIVELATVVEMTAGTSTTLVPSVNTVASYTYYKGRPNLLHNAMFNIAQGATAYTSPSTGDTTLDRWRVDYSGSMVFDINQQQVSSALVPFDNYLELDVTTADAAVAAGDYLTVSQRIEGPDCQALMFGGANARNLALRFYHKHTVEGTYCVSIRNAATNRSFVAEYTQSVADNWEAAQVYFDGDITGTWLVVDGGVGLELSFSVVAGSTYQTTADTWAAGNYVATANQVNDVHAATDFFCLAYVKLEAGDQTSEFYPLTRAQDILQCARYRNVFSGEVLGHGYSTTTTNVRTLLVTPISMMTTPTITATVANTRTRGGGNDLVPSAVSVGGISNAGALINWTVAGATANYAYTVIRTSGNVLLEANL